MRHTKFRNQTNMSILIKFNMNKSMSMNIIENINNKMTKTTNLRFNLSSRIDLIYI